MIPLAQAAAQAAQSECGLSKWFCSDGNCGLILYGALIGFAICLVIWLITKGALGYLPPLEELQNPKNSFASEVISSDMVSLAKFYLDFTVDESCGKCAPCRIGGKQMLTLLDKINRGRGKKKDLELLKQIAFAMQKASLCGLGQTAPNPVLSTLRFYEQEYENKLLDGNKEEK